VTEPMGIASIIIATITACVTLWTQRGSARVRAQSATIEERAQSLAEIQALRTMAIEEMHRMREEVSAARIEVGDLRAEATRYAYLIDVATGHIRVLRPMVPSPPGPPPVPEPLRDRF
jgi:hypothetical protein